LKWLKKQENRVHIEFLCILESQFWKVRAGVSGFLTFENIWHDWNYKNANNFLGFKTPKKYAYGIPQYFRSCCWKKTDFISNWGKPFAQMNVLTRYRLHNSSFFKSTHPLSHWLCISSTMVEQIDSNTTSTSSSASASAVSADWDIAPPLQNVRVDTQYVGMIEEQKQHIKQLQEELAEFNHVWYRTLPENASRGKNVLRTSKKVSMTATDHINQQVVALM
jgi:hypothetical protein